jgi:predicted phosphodiesterase
VITVIGDVHGKYKRYHEIIRETERHPYTVQLGDFGFDYKTLLNVDHNKHKIVGGNHDHYNRIIDIPHYLGDFGYSCLNGVNFFYYRGAYSIDQKYRTVGIDWWSEEQVNVEGFMKARELYRETRPDIVITHDCPESVSPYLLDPGSQIFQSQTGYFLQEFFNIHQPKIWLFGHYHRSWKMNINGTDFQCLNELEHTKIQ